jgi:hypothetical protein
LIVQYRSWACLPGKLHGHCGGYGNGRARFDLVAFKIDCQEGSGLDGLLRCGGSPDSGRAV